MTYCFGTFEFDDDGGALRKNGRAVAIEPQPARALTLLLSRAGDVVSREELRDAVWGRDTHVDFDRGLAYCISQVRAALGDAGDNPRFVQTVPKQGFKFIAPVSVVNAGSTGSRGSKGAVLAACLVVVVAMLIVFLTNRESRQVLIAVSIFDNETGDAQYDRPVAALSDLVVEHLTKVDPRVAVIGNAEVLRRPRNIRNLAAVADNVKADYVLLGQLQSGETGLRFITHFIRLKDQAHLKANRLAVEPDLTGLEGAVVEEFDRATRDYVLKSSSN
jgi:DNA-binding winged helix-turn-helix (wHTH) protein/TolB-like protein